MYRPPTDETIADPSCGTGGFFLSAYDFLARQKLDREQLRFLKYETFHGWEIVSNLPSERFDYVLANPPFGKKSSITATNEDSEQEGEGLTYERQDFWATTSNKQLNFLQHIRSLLKIDGKAAVVLPDNVLFEGGAGETVRKRLLASTDLHTILRLPTDIFYSQNVKANVLFFDNKPASKDTWTKEVWVYDYRTNIKHTLKTNPLKLDHLQDFTTAIVPRTGLCEKKRSVSGGSATQTSSPATKRVWTYSG